MTRTTYSWSLHCSSCSATADAAGLPTVCPDCGAPWLVRYREPPAPAAKARLAGRPWSMWRYREWLPLLESEEPVTLGEGFTPLLAAPRLGEALGLSDLWIKDESKNPTGSFKARGLSAAVTRAKLAGVPGFTVPTAGNAGVALSAYGRRAGLPVRVFAPRTTPPRILDQIRVFGADLELLDGHIGDCGRAARAHAAAAGAFDVSTLREPYRIEGKKTLGLEIAEQLGWKLPDVILYPTGGGTGLIGMWLAFDELRQAGWVTGEPPRLYSVQSTGCAPVVRAFEAGADRTEPWEDPQTIASGLRVPAPLGGPVILRALKETGGAALAVSDDALAAAERRMAQLEGVDACPEGGATLAALETLLAEGRVRPDESVVLFNTGAGWLYRRN
ncbi:MAG: threonine synthase [Gemmatimonadota bacterium]|nr:MAG: threonine synthase [Gemmatimonadota bacterium]